MPASRSRKTLGASLATGLPLLTDLILKETDRGRRTELRKLHKDLSRQLRKLVERNVDRSTSEYEKATQALEQANDAIREAKKDLAKVASTLKKLARALELIGRVAAMAT